MGSKINTHTHIKATLKHIDEPRKTLITLEYIKSRASILSNNCTENNQFKAYQLKNKKLLSVFANLLGSDLLTTNWVTANKERKNYGWIKTSLEKNWMSLIMIPELADWCSSSCITMRRVHNLHEECPYVLGINSLN